MKVIIKEWEKTYSLRRIITINWSLIPLFLGRYYSNLKKVLALLFWWLGR